MDVNTEMFTPVVKPSDVSPAPMHVLKMINVRVLHVLLLDAVDQMPIFLAQYSVNML